MPNLIYFMSDDGVLNEILETDPRCRIMDASPRFTRVSGNAYSEADSLAQLADPAPAEEKPEKKEGKKVRK